MAYIRIQGSEEKRIGIYYEYDPDDAPLGVGGMGKVYKGWLCNESIKQRTEVAIKFLYSDLPPHVIARARREAAVRLRNDNLIEMFGFVETNGRDEIGQPLVRYHVISEYLHGVTLDKLMEGNICDYKGNVIPFAQELYGKYLNSPYSFALTIVRSLLSGLMALHDSGYVHRDIDPSNIMITSDGRIKLIDFGIAKKTNGLNTIESSYTIDGQFIGKPKYAAPELARGLVDSQNATTDIYAVGILLYQLLTGKVPFDGEMAEVLEMQLKKKMPLNNVRQKQIREVIKTATQKKQSQRYQSAAEFRVAVDRLVPLEYPSKGIDVKTIGLTLISAAVMTGIIFGVIRAFNESDVDIPSGETTYIIPAEENNETMIKHADKQSSSYNKAVELLFDKKTATEGLSMLEQLVASDDYQATFLMSRLFYNKPSEQVGKFADSLKIFCGNLNLKTDIIKAHKLLEKAVSLNSNDYRSLYEIACDYRINNRRGTSQDLKTAARYMHKAKQLAKKNNDMQYLKAIEHNMYGLSVIPDILPPINQ